MAFKAIKSGFEIKQVPITFVERKNGHSKMTFLIVLEAFTTVNKYGFERIFNSR